MKLSVDCEKVKDFLELLYEDMDRGFLTLWTAPQKKSYPFRCGDTAAMAKKAEELVHSKQSVYFHVAVQNDAASPHKRGSNASAMAMAGLFHDMDVAGPGHKESALPGTVEEARQFIKSLPVQPTLIIESGGGLYPLWLFKEPWIFETDDEREQCRQFLKGWQIFINNKAKECGWKLDNTADLARVLRLPQTWNFKYDPPRPVLTGEYHPERRYNFSDFEPYLVDDMAHEKPTGETPKAAEEQLRVLRAKCRFIDFACENHGNIAEPLWYAMISNLASIRPGGPDLCHEYSKGHPKYDRNQTEQKIRHALNDTGPHTCDFIRLNSFSCAENCPVKSPVGWLSRHEAETGAAPAKEDPDPISFDDIKTPAIDCHLLPTWAGDFAGAVAKSIQVPSELAIANVLGAVATSVGGKFILQVTAGYSEPLNLFVLCPLDPGERKSATLAACSAPIEAWEAQKALEMEPEIKAVKSRLRTLEKTVEHKRTQAVKAKTPEEREKIIAEIQEIESDMPSVPNVPRLVADDVTPEAAAPLMADNGETIAILSAEGGIFDILAGRYSNGVPNLDLFLKAHSGDAARVDRKTSAPIVLRKPALNMSLSPQPEVVRGLVAKPGFRGRGLLGRFLYFMPKSLLGHRRCNPGPIPQAVTDSYRAKLLALIDYPLEPSLSGGDVPHVLSLSTKACQQWMEFWQHVEVQLRDGGRFEAMKDWAGKLPGAAARLAGLFHIIRYAGGPIPEKVEEEDMAAALEMASRLTVHAMAAFEMMGADPEIEATKHILAWMKRDLPEKFTARECHRALRGRYPKMEQIRPGLEILHERGFIFPIISGSTKAVGRPASISYRVNPKTYEEVAS